jgi:ABC-type transporter Mla maintaining outer membrane lipid asymmetry ATPase subunit MlaF
LLFFQSVILVSPAAMTPPVLELEGISKAYGALRPLRIDHLAIAEGDEVAILGLDRPAAEVLINLVTGTSLPDAGHVRIFGRPTAAITDSSDWLSTLDRFGIVSERAALLDPMTVTQNMAVPFSLEIEPPPPDIIRQAAELAAEAGLGEAASQQRVGDLDPASRMRVRLGRALAFNPAVLLLEHPTASLPRGDVIRFAVDVRSVARRRRLATLTITADPEFAGAVAARPLMLAAATGRLTRI